MKRTTTLTGALILALGATALPAVAQPFGEGHGPRGPMFSFEDMDANGDGKVTKEEIKAQGEARFKAADTNGDGSLSAEEMVASMEKMRAERMLKGAERMIARRDANKDGKLTADEMAPRNGDRMFAMMDLDEDGTVTKTEMELARKNMRGHHGDRDGQRGERGWHGPRWMKKHDAEKSE